jgi:tetratricopeptide (TPR) repeat protein
MTTCQRCGRHPAKRVTFTAHQGFVIFRRQITIEGIFCRDCALEAYFAARGQTLKGMWFSPGSLILGAFSSLWDSAKLLDLPPEVKDEPWMPHKVACPRCHAIVFTLAGPVDCRKCRTPFVVFSCPTCRAVDTVATSEPADRVKIIRCRSCSRASSAPLPVRNWTTVLLGRAVSEVAATVGQADGTICENARRMFRETIRQIEGISPQTVTWLDEYFDQCAAGRSAEVLAGVAGRSTQDFRIGTLQFAIDIARADGPISLLEWRALRSVTIALGFQPDTIFGNTYSPDYLRPPEGKSVAWWITLQVSQTATIEEIEAAYREQARQHHPDHWQNAPDSQRKDAEDRMKAINAATEEARSARQRSTPATEADHGREQKAKEAELRAAERAAEKAAAQRAKEAADEAGKKAEAQEKAAREAARRAEYEAAAAAFENIAKSCAWDQPISSEPAPDSKDGDEIPRSEGSAEGNLGDQIDPATDSAAVPVANMDETRPKPHTRTPQVDLRPLLAPHKSPSLKWLVVVMTVLPAVSLAAIGISLWIGIEFRQPSVTTYRPVVIAPHQEEKYDRSSGDASKRLADRNGSDRQAVPQTEPDPTNRHVAPPQTAPRDTFQAGIDLYVHNDYAAAIRAFDTAIAGGYTKADVYFNRGCAKRALGDFDGAKRDFFEVTSLRQDLGEGWFYLGCCLLESSTPDYPGAVDAFNQGIQIKPSMPSVYTWRGVAHSRLGHLEKALEDEALRIAPSDALATSHRNDVLNRRGTTQRALADARTRMVRGIADSREGRFGDAVANLSEAIRLNPNDAAADELRAEAYRKLGRANDASHDRAKAMELNRPNAR